MPWEAERFTPGDALMFLDGVMERKAAQVDLFDGLALSILSAFNPEAANQIRTERDLMERKRRSEE